MPEKTNTTESMSLPNIPEHRAQEEDPQYPRIRRDRHEHLGTQDFKEDHVPREGVEWKKRDGHPSLFQEDPINELAEMSIETNKCEEPHWE